MGEKHFTFVTGLIFLLIAILHVLRLVYGWKAVIGGWMVPMWLSWVALVIAAYLAYTGFRLSKKLSGLGPGPKLGGREHEAL